MMHAPTLGTKKKCAVTDLYADSTLLYILATGQKMTYQHSFPPEVAVSKVIAHRHYRESR